MSHLKSAKLGMSFATARARLERDLLFSLAIAAGHTCFRCGGELDRKTFSVEHKAAWMQAEDPKSAFFNLGNIAFSHISCNTRDMIDRRREYPNKQAAWRAASKRRWDALPDKVASRRERYLKTGH